MTRNGRTFGSRGHGLAGEEAQQILSSRQVVKALRTEQQQRVPNRANSGL
jgi:hypothetical protein